MSISKKINHEEPLSPHVLQKHEAARCVVDEEGSVVYANDAFCELSGIRADAHYHLLDIIQLPEEVFDDEDPLSELETGTHDVHIQDNGFMTEFHFDWITTSDNRRFLIASALEDEFHERTDDNLDMLMERIQDSAARIETSSHHTEHTDPQHSDEYTPFVDMTQDMMVITDISGRIVHANNAFAELSGEQSRNDGASSFFDLFKPEDQSHIIRSHQSLAQGQLNNQTLNFEAQIITPSGHVRWIEWQQKYENNQVYSIGRDITDIKEKHRNLQRREKQLSEAEAIGRMGHWQWLIGEEYISWSEEIYRIFGVDQNHFKPSINTLTSLVHKRDLGRVVQVFQRAIIEEKNYDMEFRVIRPGGDIRFVMCEGRCEKNAEGEVIALYGIMQDMTERMLYEEELRRAKDASEQAYAAKTRFLANMSHELRTPLNAIIGFSEMIESQMLGPIFNEKYTEYASSIKESGHHLLDLISDILDMSKIEAGKHVLDLETVLIKDVIDRCFEMMQGRAAEQHVIIRPFEINNKDFSIIGDRRALIQIFLNLLSNAVKFTPENGSVWIECYESNDYLIFKVCDTGVGIPPNKLASVLRPFEQASSEYTREHEGTGLGLAITKELIELHGGSIQIESTVNIGTTVSVRLPFQIQSS
mgnify:CR=1 FL=1